jgi:hypothetical protein
MKARDLVPGWPRPRSTVVLAWNWRCFSFGGRYLRGRVAEDEWLKYESERKANDEYHEGQQAMVDSYFERYRAAAILTDLPHHLVMYRKGA